MDPMDATCACARANACMGTICAHACMSAQIVGYFMDAVDAAHARDCAALGLQGNPRLNFHAETYTKSQVLEVRAHAWGAGLGLKVVCRQNARGAAWHKRTLIQGTASCIRTHAGGRVEGVRAQQAQLCWRACLGKRNAHFQVWNAHLTSRCSAHIHTRTHTLTNTHTHARTCTHTHTYTHTM